MLSSVETVTGTLLSSSVRTVLLLAVDLAELLSFENRVVVLRSAVVDEPTYNDVLEGTVVELCSSVKTVVELAKEIEDEDSEAIVVEEPGAVAESHTSCIEPIWVAKLGENCPTHFSQSADPQLKAERARFFLPSLLLVTAALHRHV